MLYELDQHQIDFPKQAPELGADSKVIVWQGTQLLVSGQDIAWRYSQLVDAELDAIEFVALLDGKGYFTASLAQGQLDGQLATLRDIAVISETAFSLCARARSLLDWANQHRFCGQCGQATQRIVGEPATSCEPCGVRFYPRISPCVIVLITRGDEVLLAQGRRHRGAGMYGAVAGFIEAGESAEQAVIREVREELGVEVAQIRYQNSQAWPFPNQLMLGYTAEYLSGDVVPEVQEIVDAAWFNIHSLPKHPPTTTIAGWLIRQYQLERQAGR